MRLYLNGWPAFAQLPWLRSFVLPDGGREAASSMQGCIEVGVRNESCTVGVRDMDRAQVPQGL